MKLVLFIIIWVLGAFAIVYLVDCLRVKNDGRFRIGQLWGFGKDCQLGLYRVTGLNGGEVTLISVMINSFSGDTFDIKGQLEVYYIATFQLESSR